MYIKEEVDKELDAILLNEGVETKNMKAAKHYLYDKMNYNEQQAMKCIGSIKTDIPNSRLAKCKFMLGIVRMFCDGQLSDGQTIMNLNKTLKYAASNAHVNEYDQNLNNLSAQQIIQRFATSAQQDLEQDKNDVAQQQYEEQKSQYQIVKIRSYEEAEDYGEYVDWCVTHDSNMYNSYTNNGNGVFYFCLRNGWENEEEVKGENCPLDSYGLSMIAVSINGDGSCNTITCRWNHDNGGTDSVMTPKELSQVINRNFYEVFKPLTPEEIQQNRKRLLNVIDNEIENDLDYYGEYSTFCEVKECDPELGNSDERVAYVYYSESGDVILDEEGYFLIDEVFNDIGVRTGDIMSVKIDNKQNFINMDGKIISNTWYDKVINIFDVDLGMVYLKNKNKWSLINRNGEIIFPWVDVIYDSVYGSLKGSNIIEYIDKGKTGYYDLNGGGELFASEIERVIFMPPYVDDEYKPLRLIKFVDGDSYELYNMDDGELISDCEFSGMVGRTREMPSLSLKNQQNVYYVLDPGGNLYTRVNKPGANVEDYKLVFRGKYPPNLQTLGYNVLSESKNANLQNIYNYNDKTPNKDMNKQAYKNKIKEAIDKQVKSIMSEMVERENNKNFSKSLTEDIMSHLTNDGNDSDLWVEVRFVQMGDDYEEIMDMFCGDQDGYCEANSQPVIDYLKQWDEGECEIVKGEPRIARNDTVYEDENGPYILRYNSSIGGVFLLYRPATEQEIEWYNDRGGELNESVEYDDYSAISRALGECGWAYSNAYDVKNRTTGQVGIRYIIEPYPNNLDGVKPCSADEVKQKMTQFIGEKNVVFSEGQHKYAPEIKNLSMVVFES